MSKRRLYIIGNSHMDPIWLWHLREGRSTWLNTCRSVVNMMKKYPFLKFSRSSSACYRWIEDTDPQLFRDIQKFVEENRWELVGGWVEQSDTIITPGESLLRQAEHAKKYFKEKFGKDVHVAYSVDSFGQNTGLPKILKETGFDCYAWMRPNSVEKEMPNRFRWRCDDKSGDILSFRILGSYQTGPYLKYREDFMGHLNAVLAASNTEDQTFFFGVGDHGGGIYEKQLNWLLELEDQYELVFSTLEDYFAIMAKEDLPILEGEHVHHAPGCYSANSAIKHWMSDTEKNFYKAEKITLQGNWHDRQKNIAALNDAWGEFLFNYFHDIYPGTSIRSAYEHEIRDINGYANHQATTILEQGLSRIGATINTDFLTEGGVMLWNSLSVPVMGKGSYDTFSDPNYSGSRFNCLIDGEGNRIPLQWINAESGLNIFNCWGKAVFTSPMKASQAKAFAFGRTDEFDAEKVGYDRQKKLLERIRFQVLDDLGDTWAHGVKELGPTLGDARLVDVKELDNGPVVSLIHAFYEWKNSKFELKLYAWKDIEEIEAEFIADWQERKETLKICLETGVADAPVLSGQMASSIRRKPDICEQPFIDFVSVDGNGFMAEYFHSYDSIGSGELRLTLIRPIVYTQEVPRGDEGYADIGQLWHKFWIFTDGEKDVTKLEAKARALLWGCEHLEITKASDGSAFELDEYEIVPEFITASCSRVNGDQSREFHLYNPGDQEVTAQILCNGKIAASQKLMPRAFKKVIF